MGESIKGSRRFVVGLGGRKMNGAPNYAVGDTMPAIDSDGRCADFDTLPEAQAWADELESRHVRALAERSDGCKWLKVPGRHFYAWLRPVTQRDWCDD